MGGGLAGIWHGGQDGEEGYWLSWWRRRRMDDRRKRERERRGKRASRQ